MRSLWMVAAVAVIACKNGRAADQGKQLDAACLEALRSGDAARALDRCRPCGVSWQPLVALSSTDPDAEPGRLPSPDEVFAVLDTCGATCQGTARTEVAELLRSAQEGHAPAAPWRRVAERCDALRVDDGTLRFARGTWYAFDQIARAIWADDARAEVAALRDDPPSFPLPPLTTASTGFAMPRVDQLAGWRPRAHVTISESQVHAGPLPWVVLGKDGPALRDAPGSVYPGDEVAPGGLRAAVDRLGEERVVAIAPRGLRVPRLLEVIAELARPVYLAATPRTRTDDPWPEPVFAIPVALSPTPDGAEPLVLRAGQQVSELAEALGALAGRGVATAYVTIDPLSSP